MQIIYIYYDNADFKTISMIYGKYQGDYEVTYSKEFNEFIRLLKLCAFELNAWCCLNWRCSLFQAKNYVVNFILNNFHSVILHIGGEPGGFFFYFIGRFITARCSITVSYFTPWFYDTIADAFRHTLIFHYAKFWYHSLNFINYLVCAKSNSK